ncbi:hypothetical protein [Litoreibacter halocynthiae]|uniref:hypothetical protein n=1 Tax=Litoreibacter halocynthiae TaxID=1242689 RepID=UPI00248FD41D|nr:hypothetical protein [Litoreibacter halocynthiae]
MASANNNSKIAELMKLVFDERQALIDGKIEGLAEISSQKQKTIESVSKYREQFSDTDVAVILSACGDLQDLYRSAQAGLVAARSRLQSVQCPSEHLKTYDAAGRNQGFQISTRERFF